MKLLIKIYRISFKLLLKLLPVKSGLQLLFLLDNELYKLQNNQAVHYGRGTHPKHQQINYHQFFIDEITPHDCVLDIGSSTGDLTADIARQTQAKQVYGVEMVQSRVADAQARHQLNNLQFIHQDITHELPAIQVTVVMLSNVLEHIENRPRLLQQIVAAYHPKKILIRVPSFERDWRVPLKQALGISYLLDSTHYIEYTKSQFMQEMQTAGLTIESLSCEWGEFRAVLRPLA